MKNLYLFCLALLLPSFSFGTVPNLPKQGTLTDFVPQNYTEAKTATGEPGKVEGDLNKDGKSDVVMVLQTPQAKQSAPDFPNYDRLVIILFNNGDGTYSLSSASDKIVLCARCGGMMGEPFDSISIKNGVLLISHFGGSADKWGYLHRWRFQNNGWYLIGQTVTTTYQLESKEVDTNYSTGKSVTTESKEGTEISKKESSNPQLKPIALEQFDINNNL